MKTANTKLADNIWPPGYARISKERFDRLKAISNDNELIRGALSYYKKRDKVIDFIQDWCITYDPRNALNNLPTTMPFILFDRQKEMVEFLISCLNDQESGLIEKSRDMGATWICCAISVWLWLFVPGASIGWGSRKEDLVDKLGDPDSIFEKIRMTVRYLPFWMLPYGYNEKKHSSFMKLINPEIGGTITGESGDNIGRGGRKLIYFKDESAHYERPERIEAALSETTNCQVDISSVHGTANIFYRRRESGEEWDAERKFEKGKVRIFIMDWSDHPLKDKEWYDNKKNKAESEGLLQIFSQEIDRDYASSVEGILIPPDWVRAAIDAHENVNLGVEGLVVGALDVADEGGDENAIAFRKGIVLKHIDSWGEVDTGLTANKAVEKCRSVRAKELYYDCIGVGAGVKGETNRLKRNGLIKNDLEIHPWNAAARPLHPKKHIDSEDNNSPKNKDFYANLKAQGWWSLRRRFENTYNAVVKGKEVDYSETISIPSNIDKIHEVKKQLSQPTYGFDGKKRIIINKKPSGTKSPNLADAIMMAYHPAKGFVARAIR
jgi:hypothetical protein